MRIIRRALHQPILLLGLNVLAVVLTMSLAAACVIPPSLDRQIITDRFPVSGSDLLVIDLGSGLVELTGIEGATEIQVVAEVKFPDRMEYMAVQAGGTVKVTAKSVGIHILQQGSANVKVSLPRQFKVEVRTSNGDIHARQTTGIFGFRTSNGEITVENGQGEFNLKSANGDIDFKGELSPQSNNQFSTSNGDITVVLEGEFPSVRLQAETSNGGIYQSHPVSEVEQTNRSLSGVIGSGNSHLTLKTSNGDIRVE